MTSNRTVGGIDLFIAISLVVLSAAAPTVFAGLPNFQKRVAAQRALEEVYWRHRIWPDANTTPKPPLSAVLSDEAVRSKVEDYLRKSNALEKWWRQPVTGDQLQTELERMSQNTRDPEMLRELYAALENDAGLIAETLGRQTLVERLVRERYARDDRFHGGVRRGARETLAGIRAVAEMNSLDGRYVETTYRLRIEDDEPARGGSAEQVVELETDDWNDRQAELAERFGTSVTETPLLRPSELQEDADRFFIVALLSRSEDETTVASVVWPKRSFDDWWEEEATHLAVDVEADRWVFRLPAPSGSTCDVDSWRERFYLPTPRFSHTAVWTGTEMIVWGGYGNSVYAFLNTGGRYNPSTDSWVPTSSGSAVPAGRYLHTAVWTGTEMIVWGGGGGQYHSTGGRYDPLTDTWQYVSSSSLSGRTGHTAIWTGTEMIIWGGNNSNATWFNNGARYNPSTNSWTATSVGPSVPEQRSGHVAVWTGTKMIVWGGVGRSGVVSYYFDTGGRYDPSADAWAPTKMDTDAPSPRSNLAAVWSGTAMIVWGGLTRIGNENVYHDTGGRYDLSSDTWTSTALVVDTPTARYGHTAVWTGTEMIVWGGAAAPNTGGRYDPTTDSWVSTSMGVETPSARYSHTAVWTGTEMIVWGGSPGRLDTGGRYDPTTDSWVATSTGGDVPVSRHSHTAVWTGAEMIVWGGYNEDYLNTGGRYDLATDSWMPTSTGTEVPSGRYHHSVAWTGTEMIVWGGLGLGPRDTGGRYDPSTNSWLSTSLVNVPSGRERHTAVWTGNEMIVWGGAGGSLTGGRYDPTTDSWAPTSTGADTPSSRADHTAVWTGTVMIIWGGYGDGEYLDTGSRYDPTTDSWARTVTFPYTLARRKEHTAVWTGTEMIAWGGYDAGGYVLTGGLYNPATDDWEPMWDHTWPAKRHRHTAVWTGAEMIVWGGYNGDYLDEGSRYDPEQDTWVPLTPGIDEPHERRAHTAVWTGNEMIVWGGSPGTRTLSFYCACNGPRLTYRDFDGDGHGDPSDSLVTDRCSIPPGYVANADDCVDLDASIHPGAAEVNDGEDNQCPGDPGHGMVDEIQGDAGFHSPTNKDEYSWPAQPGAASYEVARSNDPEFASSCATSETLDTYWIDSTPTPPSACSYYLVRPLTPHAGSWGQDSGGAERAIVCP